jgi:hypothetical protein
VIIHLAFSTTDGRYIAAQYGPPTYNLVYYAWEKGKLLAQESVCKDSLSSVTSISCNPGDGTQVLAVGRRTFKLFAYGEGKFSVTTFTKMEHEVSCRYISDILFIQKECM